MNSSNQNTKIPYRLRVGVTGHRRLPDDDALPAQVSRAIDRARELVASSDDLPVRLRVISPIAEGADRLVAHAGLADETTELEVPLPMPREQYAEDFETDESKAEFDALLEQADLVTVMSESQTREEAYERAGRHVVDRCDVLIALWDGEPSRGRGRDCRGGGLRSGRRRPDSARFNRRAVPDSRGVGRRRQPERY